MSGTNTPSGRGSVSAGAKEWEHETESHKREEGAGDSTEKGYGEVLVPLPLPGGARSTHRKLHVSKGVREDLVHNPKSNKIKLNLAPNKVLSS